MSYKPNQQLPLLLFGIVLAPLSVLGLLKIGSALAFELAALITMLVGMVAAVGVIQHWRFG